MTEVQHDLTVLERAGLIRVAQLEPEIEYLFRHELMRDAVYDNLVRHQRKELHRLAGEAIERLYPERLEELSPMLAYHFDQAEDSERAVGYAKMAGDAASRRYANAEAVIHYSRALELARKGQQVDKLRTLYHSLGHAYEHIGRFSDAVSLYETMRTEAAHQGDRSQELAAIVALMTIRSTPTAVFNQKLAHQLAEEGLPIAREIGDQEAEAGLLWNLSNLHAQSGEFVKAARYGEQSLAIARKLGVKERIAYALNDLASFSYAESGQYEKGKAALGEAEQLWIELNNQPMLADCLCTRARLEVPLGQYDDAIAYAHRASEIAERVDNPWGRSHCRFAIGDVYFQRGEIDQAIEVYEACVLWGERAGFLGAIIGPGSNHGLLLGLMGHVGAGMPLIDRALGVADGSMTAWRGWPLGNLARLRVSTGDLAGVEQALSESTAPGMTGFIESLMPQQLARCELALARGEFETALDEAEAQLAILRPRGAQAFMPEYLLLKGRALVGLKKPDEARLALREALEIAAALQACWLLWQICGELAEIEGDARQRDSLREQARQQVEFVSGHTGDPVLRRSFLSLPAVEAVMR